MRDKGDAANGFLGKPVCATRNNFIFYNQQIAKQTSTRFTSKFFRLSAKFGHGEIPNRFQREVAKATSQAGQSPCKKVRRNGFA
jgi:hypothetical protein